MLNNQKTKTLFSDEFTGLGQKISYFDEDSYSRLKTQKILDSFPFYVLLIDSDHQIVMMNKVMQKQLGTDSANVIGKYCPKVVHGCSRPFPGCPLEEAVKCNRSVEKELFDDKQQKWFLSSIYLTDCQTKEGKRIYLHIIHDITDRKRAENELIHSYEKLDKSLTGFIKTMAKTIELKDPYTSGHQIRVANLACMIAKKMGLEEDRIKGINMAATIHDLGKISVPSDILSKPGRLSKVELSLIKFHPKIGYNILKSIEFPWPIAKIVLQHHERLDGSGYPNHLKAEDICLEARILAVADVMEAMSSHRPYRPALGIDTAIEEISKNSGILYDPNVVETCISLFKDDKFKF